MNRIHPQSIILAGSFGRGEGSVIFENSSIWILSDYEIGVVTNKFWKRRFIEGLAEEISTKIGVETSICWFYPSRLRKNKFKNLSLGKSLPSIAMYEWKAGSRLLCGKNCLKENIINPEDIPLWEGIRLIFNRMIESLENLPPNFPQIDTNSNSVQNTKFLKWVDKILIACADALLISLRKYHYSYQIRMSRFEEVYPKYFQNIFKNIPEFPTLIRRAYQFKINPLMEQTPNPSELWIKTTAICDKVFRYVINKELDINFGTYSEFSDRYLSHPSVRNKYYFFRLGPLRTPIYENLIYFLKMLRRKKLPSARILEKAAIPWHHIVYSVAPLIFFSVSSDNKINEEYLNSARMLLRYFSNLENPSSDAFCEWDYLRVKLLEAWHIICW